MDNTEVLALPNEQPSTNGELELSSESVERPQDNQPPHSETLADTQEATQEAKSIKDTQTENPLRDSSNASQSPRSPVAPASPRSTSNPVTIRSTPSPKSRPPSHSVSTPTSSSPKKWTVNFPPPISTRSHSPFNRPLPVPPRDSPTFLNSPPASRPYSSSVLSTPTVDTSLKFKSSAVDVSAPVSAGTNSASSSNDLADLSSSEEPSPQNFAAKSKPPVPTKSPAVLAVVQQRTNSTANSELRSPPPVPARYSGYFETVSISPMVSPRPPQMQLPLTPEERDKLRANLAMEMLKTEQFYVKSLKTIITSYLEPLKASLSTEDPLLNQEAIKGLFSNVEIIYNLHQDFLTVLEGLISNWDNTSKLGPQFIKMAPFFKVYMQYINNYNHSMQVYQDAMKRKKFQKFMIEAAVGNDLDNWPSYCIQPVQRIPKYLLILNELSKNTPESHVDSKDLKSAIDSLTVIATEINAHKKEAENLTHCAFIQNTLVYPDNHAAKKQLVVPTRRFLREGRFEVYIAGTSTPYNYLVLFNDILLITKAKKKNLYYHGILYLNHVSLGDPEDDEISLTFKSLVLNVTVVVIFTSAEEKNGWLRDARAGTCTGEFVMPESYDDEINSVLDPALDENSPKRGLSLGASDSKTKKRRFLTLGSSKKDKHVKKDSGVFDENDLPSRPKSGKLKKDEAEAISKPASDIDTKAQTLQ